jgi:hypothetical protein
MSAPECAYCNELIWHSRVWSPDCLPDDIPLNWWGKDETSYHPSCWETIIAEARHELALKHGDG